jgi:hypothetical protein
MKKTFLLLGLLLIIPISLALESNVYFVTSEIGSEVFENVEITGKADELDLIELKLPLNIEDITVIFNAEEIECVLKEEVGYSLLSCPVDSYAGSYFLKLIYIYKPVNLDDRIYFKTVHEPEAESFVFIAKLDKNYRIPENEVGSLVSPQFTNTYFERDKQVFVWKINNADSFEGTLVAESIGDYRDGVLGVLILIGLGMLFYFYKRRKKEVLPKFIEVEQKIVDTLKLQKKPIKQKDLQKIVGFSKARLSRILNNLEKRGVVNKIPWGRTKLIELKQK